MCFLQVAKHPHNIQKYISVLIYYSEVAQLVILISENYLKIDYGSILLSVKEEDIDALDSILSSNIFEKPTIKMSVYKNRRGRYKGIIMWCKADLGTCRIQPMFCTTYDYELINMDDIKIIVEKGAWDDDEE